MKLYGTGNLNSQRTLWFSVGVTTLKTSKKYKISDNGLRKICNVFTLQYQSWWRSSGSFLPANIDILHLFKFYPFILPDFPLIIFHFGTNRKHLEQHFCNKPQLRIIITLKNMLLFNWTRYFSTDFFELEDHGWRAKMFACILFYL